MQAFRVNEALHTLEYDIGHPLLNLAHIESDIEELYRHYFGILDGLLVVNMVITENFVEAIYSSRGYHLNEFHKGKIITA